jgi:hypothetical protein
VRVRVLVSSTPEYSHLGPQIPLALELHRRGHEVLVACGSKLGDWVDTLGLTAEAAGLDLDPDRVEAGLGAIIVERGIEVPSDLSPGTVDRWARGAIFLGIFANARPPASPGTRTWTASSWRRSGGVKTR